MTSSVWFETLQGAGILTARCGLVVSERRGGELGGLLYLLEREHETNLVPAAFEASALQL